MSALELETVLSCVNASMSSYYSTRRKLATCNKTAAPSRANMPFVKNKKSVPTHCSPVRYCRHRLAGTCLMPEEISKILRANGISSSRSTSEEKLLSLLRSLGRRKGVSEQVLSNDKFSKAFRPAAPKSWQEPGNSQWLSSDDIESVMRQYELSTPDFRFVGVTPINFDDRPLVLGGRCVSPAMCALDIAKIVENGRITHLGVVLNMDKHDSGGSHWVSVYIGLDAAALNYGVYYYDSIASPPGRHVSAWMRGIAKIATGRRKFAVVHNKVRRQYGQTECGIFAMMFLIHCMQRKSSFQDICQKLGRDDAMKPLRSVLFRPART